MDGKNVDTVLTELGVRFHRLIHEHLQQYSYSSMGGMLAICDVAEYRRCAKDFRVSGGGRGPAYAGHRAKHGSSSTLPMFDFYSERPGSVQVNALILG